MKSLVAASVVVNTRTITEAVIRAQWIGLGCFYDNLGYDESYITRPRLAKPIYSMSKHADSTSTPKTRRAQ